ncbi:hypothetical protein M9H77_33533 [Catharanthus roseus]|uniref:Uncharacterized protein n=1 Tax=Catharanthus roseus TaxID=4058 RepID=A0ACB9ZKE8_CATRO|nr:hypothetical protein M9H77_33533 [Catharanthus roseus]
MENRPNSEQITEYFKFRPEEEPRFEVRNTVLVIAILITTATYQACLSPPGGLWQDNSDGHRAGTSIMATNNIVSYTMFVVFNSIGFFTSLFMIFALTGKFPMRIALFVALNALTWTFDASMAAMTPNTIVRWMFNALSIVLPFIVSFVTAFLKVKFEETPPATPNRPPV